MAEPGLKPRGCGPDSSSLPLHTTEESPQGEGTAKSPPQGTLWVTVAMTSIRITPFSLPPFTYSQSFTQTESSSEAVTNYLNPMRTHKLPVRVLIGDLLLPQSHAVAPVQRADVVLHGFRHLPPVMPHCTGDKTDTQPSACPAKVVSQKLFTWNTKSRVFSWRASPSFQAISHLLILKYSFLFRKTTRILSNAKLPGNS